jgi:hypothetical protein
MIPAPIPRRFAVVLVAASVALGACKSPEEKLVDRRQALRATLDGVYDRYLSEGGGRSDGKDGGLLERFVGELDRSHFEESCLAMGRGERGFTFSRRLEAFLEDSGNARRCRKAARIEAEVAALQRDLAAPRAGAPR